MRTDHPVQSGTYFFFNLGCPKNLVDAESAAARLENAGWRQAAFPEAAELLVVTTCAFISSAMEESVEEILRVGASKSPEQRLAVLGCLVSREETALRKLLPEVDIFCTVAEMPFLAERIGARVGREEARGGEERVGAVSGGGTCASLRTLFTPPHLAYLKIADGCSNRCGYCMIPAIRGDLVSRTREDILREAAALAASGVKELSIIAQDTSAWGYDRDRRECLYDLIEALADAARFDWIRLMYLHPAHIEAERLVPLIRGGALCPYLDIPIQHVSDRILKRMGRPYARRDLAALFDRLRSSIDDLVLRTTVMVGFPGETDADFRELADFLEETAFDHVGVFTFSPEQGTEAYALRKRIPEGIALERKDALLDLQMDISQERLNARLGSELAILVDSALPAGERPSREIGWVGRFFGQAFEVDGVTYLRGAVPGPGAMVRGRVHEAQAYDLIAEVTSV